MSSDLDRAAAVIGYIKSAGAPNKYKTRPCPLAHPAAMEQVLAASASWTIQPQVFAPDNEDRVLNTKGLILWFPKYGVNALYHMGIVDQGSVSKRNATFLWNSMANYYGVGRNALINGNSTIYGTLEFIYPFALALPRGDLPIVIEPPMATQFSKARGYSGMVEVWSSTIASGQTTLNGLLTTAVISDTRDICQKSDGTDAFATSALQQSSRTYKEIVNEISAATGVVSLQGGDIDESYLPPDGYANVTAQSGWVMMPVLQKTAATVVNFTPITAGLALQTALYLGWFSPWGVQQIEGLLGQQSHPDVMPFTQGINGSAVPIPQIAEMGYCDCKLECQLLGSRSITTSTETVCVAFDHVFAMITDSTNGTIGYRSIRTVRYFQIGGPGPNVSNNDSMMFSNTAQTSISLDTQSDIRDEYIAAGGFAGLGKFIGCKVSIVITSSDTSASAGTGSYFLQSRGCTARRIYAGGSNATDLDKPTGPQISFKACEINSVGQTGPCHVIRYDNIGPTQSMRIQGHLNTEAVAKSVVANLVRGQMMNTRMAMDANAYPLLYALFNGDSSFKCSWDRMEYARWVATVIDPLTPESLLDMGQNDSNINQAVSASGLFQTLGANVGRMLGHEGFGNLAGSFADSIMGKRVSAGGQFGVQPRFGGGGGGQYGIDAAAEFGVGQNIRARDWV